MKKYLFLILFVSFLKNINGQMYTAGTMFQSYYDVDPDTILNYVIVPYTHETFGIDMYDDASIDILLTAHGAGSSSGSSAYINVTSLNSNVYIMFGRWDSVYVPASSNWDITKVAKPLIVTDPIDLPGATWDNGTLYLTDHSGHGGGNKTVNDWVGTDKFLAIKYETGNSVSYGWIRLKCPDEDSCYVKDLSYTQVTIGINELSENVVELFPNPSNNSFYLKNMNEYPYDPSKLALTNMFGLKVKFSYEISGRDIKIIPDGNLPDGCYMLQYISNEFILSKKVVKRAE